MDMKTLEISIIGAGIGGLAAALALARTGAKVTVFEQAEALGEVGAGLQISPNGVAVLEALGLRADAAKLATTPEAVVLRDYRGGEVARLAMGKTAEARYGRPYWQFHRADLLKLLENGARAAGVTLVFGHKLAGVKPQPDGVDLEFTSGVHHHTSCLIGADGVRSTLRDLVFEGQPASFTGHVAWRGLVKAEKLPAGLFENAAQVFMGKGRHLVAYPLRGGSLINFVAVEERKSWAAEGWNIPDTAENLRAAFTGFGSPVQALLNAVEETFLWGLFNHPVLPRWHKGRVVLLGDACHPMLPYLAQGAVMGLEDAYVLARSLEAADTPEAGLAAYEMARKPRATRVQKGAAANARAYHLRNPLVRGAAHKALALMPQGALIGRFDWLYALDVTAVREA
ncbi:MAG: FAD-dependent monooxygenase [Rhodobacteraceae bacterium]|nr:FAD-dependent monooxygenase [Paracoccaceae bacterium]